jgi:hypothetical protein
MTNTLRTVSIFVAGVTLSSCSMWRAHRSPIARESAQLKATGQETKDRGAKMVADGIDLQNKARETRVLVNDKRRQADALDKQDDAAGANQFRLEANSQEAEATASESRGREMEQQGRELMQEGEEALNRATRLEQEGEQVPRKSM